MPRARTVSKGILRWTFASLLLLISAVRAPAATFTVTKTANTADEVCDSDCSLWEAINAANQAIGSDTIIVPAGFYVATVFRLHILDDVEIRGVID